MTALCGGGTSSIKPGVPQNVAVAGSLITAGLAEISPWLTPFAGVIDGFLYQATNQCTGDPPPMPTFDASDVTNLIGGIFNPNLNVTLTKVNNLLLNWAWWQYCVCDAPAVTPPMPTPLPQPPGVQLQQPQAPTPCFSGSTSYHPKIGNPGGGTGINFDITPQLLPNNGSISQTFFLDPSIRLWVMPPGVTSIAFQSFEPNTVGCGQAVPSLLPVLEFFDSASNHLGANQPFVGPQHPAANTSGTIAIPANAFYYVVLSGFSTPTCGDPQGDAVTKTQVFCGGGGTSLSNCCPPDPAIAFALNQILNALQQLQTELPQRTTAFTRGTTHTGLHGSGVFALAADVAALDVEITSTSAAQGEIVGNPGHWFNLGWITPEVAGTPYASTRLETLSQFVPVRQLADAVHFTLGPGVTANVTELEPIPATSWPA